MMTLGNDAGAEMYFTGLECVAQPFSVASWLGYSDIFERIHFCTKPF